MKNYLKSFPASRGLNLCIVTTESGSGYRFLPLGFALEVMFFLVLSATIPGSVPTLMSWIWPETRD